MAQAARTSKTTSPTVSDGAKRSSSSTLRAQLYLGKMLPVGFLSFFETRRAGRYYGLRIKCPHCELTPPRELLGSQRWRYLAVHIAKVHGGK